MMGREGLSMPEGEVVDETIRMFLTYYKPISARDRTNAPAAREHDGADSTSGPAGTGEGLSERRLPK